MCDGRKLFLSISAMNIPHYFRPSAPLLLASSVIEFSVHLCTVPGSSDIISSPRHAVQSSSFTPLCRWADDVRHFNWISRVGGINLLYYAYALCNSISSSSACPLLPGIAVRTPHRDSERRPTYMTVNILLRCVLVLAVVGGRAD